MSEPVILVCGLGRCGTTMVMHMLAAGGIDCVGCPPGYEPEEVNHRPIGRDWLRLHEGEALKVLNPHLCPLPAPGEVWTRVIWLDRSGLEQARSQMKFAALMLGLPTASRQHVRRVFHGLASERAQGLRALADRERINLRFEDILDRPGAMATAISRFVHPSGPLLDIPAMCGVVRPRPPECAPFLDIELELSALAEARS